MILRRLGNKSKLANKIQGYFPEHSIFIEPFFGAGGMFFNKSKVKHNFLNDLDSDVFNLFQVISNRKQEFMDMFENMPLHNDLFKYWMDHQENDPVKKAIRFVLLSNFSLYGTMSTLRFGCDNPKKKVYENIDATVDYIKGVQFTNCDFRKMFKSISLNEKEKSSTFIYCDPPYINTTNNYSDSFTEKDTNDLFETLIATNMKFAISEFNNEIITDLARKHKLQVIIIGERNCIKARRSEILVTNYENKQKSLFD